MAKSQSVGNLLNNANTGLAKVVSRAKELKKLTSLLKSMVDAPLSDHIYVANIRGTTLIIGTDSAAWHTRVKYLAPMLLDQMRQLPDMARLQQIEFRVQPFSAAVSDKTKTQTQQLAHSGDGNKQLANSGDGENSRSTGEDSLDQRLEHLAKKIRDTSR